MVGMKGRGHDNFGQGRISTLQKDGERKEVKQTADVQKKSAAFDRGFAGSEAWTQAVDEVSMSMSASG